jgi:HAE1 family hydrophobic/amphiphilic exporter-1
MLQDKSGNTPQELGDQVQRFITEARKRPEIGRIATFYRTNVPQIFANVDRDKVLKQGASISDVNVTLGSLLGSSYINDFNRFGRTYKVYLSAEGQYRNEVWDLSQFFVRNSQGSMVPLNTLVSMGPTNGPDFTNRFNLFRSAEITGVPAPGYTSDQALKALEEVAAQVLPQGWGYDWSNMSYQEVKAAGTGATVFIFALLFVFLILSAQYESWSLPTSVLLGIPFAVFGAMGGLWIGRFFSDSYVNNIFAQIGFVTLIGLAAKNAILIVEFAKMKQEAGEDIVTAALDAAKLRLRPILMTSFAFILGVVPLVRASGAGAESRKVMGLSVFSGLLVATSLAIFIIPSLFVMVEKYFVKNKKSKIPFPATPDNSGSEEKGGH